MNTKSSVRYILALGCLFILTDTSQMMAANIRGFIEAVRRKAPVVYVGSVREVHLLTRTKFDIKARAVVSVADSFTSIVPPGYLLQGKREELLQRVETLRDSLNKMSPDQLKLHEINEEDRQIQLALYEKLYTYLRTP